MESFSGPEEAPQGITQGQTRHRGSSWAWHIAGTAEALGNIPGCSLQVQKYPAGIRQSLTLEQILKCRVSRQPGSAAAGPACQPSCLCQCNPDAPMGHKREAHCFSLSWPVMLLDVAETFREAVAESCSGGHLAVCTQLPPAHSTMLWGPDPPAKP